jgi:tRNA(Ile)-lysidine synthase
MNLEKTFTEFLKRENLVGKKLLLAVSGGVDSMTLLDVVSRTVDGKDVSVFHLDHGTRKQSKKDAEVVQILCSTKDIPFYGEKLDSVPSKNKENSWREERNIRSKNAAKHFGAERILTAHHATDLVETMIFRLTKGTGLAGLSPFDISTKPFWNVPRSEIEAYAKKNKIKFVEDKSNKDIEFERNLIRHKVVPHLRKITPNLEKVFVTEAEIFSETAKFVQLEMKRHLQSKNIALEVFCELHPTLQKEFLRHIASKTPSSSEVDDCLKWICGNPKGNSKKSIGGTKLKIMEKKLMWE